MNPNDWNKVKFFRACENWGNSDLIDAQLVYRLDDMRAYLGVPIIISCGTQGQHSRNSWHYKGQAVDILVPTFSGTLLDLLLIAERFNWGGIGVYPDWTWQNKRCGGLHLDTRELQWEKDGTLNYRNARWLGRKTSTGNQYFPLESRYLKKHGIVSLEQK